MSITLQIQRLEVDLRAAETLLPDLTLPQDRHQCEDLIRTLKARLDVARTQARLNAMTPKQRSAVFNRCAAF